MKELINFRIFTILALYVVLATSCEKSEDVEKIDKEDFMSLSENSSTSFDEESENVKILLHMSFDATVNKEDAKAQFEKAIVEYSKEKQLSKSPRNTFNFMVRTKTLNNSDFGTDGVVHARVYFQTDIGLLKYTRRLDNPNRNDFEKGKTDFFYLEATTPAPICEVSVRRFNTAIGLKGTDSWGVREFSVDITQANQYPIPSSGSSEMDSFPYTVLANISSNFWDKYEITTNQPTGTLSFGCN